MRPGPAHLLRFPIFVLFAFAAAGCGCSDSGLRTRPAEPPPPIDARLELTVEDEPDAGEAWFGEVEVGDVAELRLWLRAVGTDPVEVDALALTEGLGFTLVSAPTLPATMDPGSLSPIDVTFTPIEDGLKTGTIEASGTDPDGAPVVATLTLRGDGLGPAIQVTPEEHDFGTWPFGCAPETVAVIENVGRGTLVLGDVLFSASSPEFEAATELPAAGTALAPGEQHAVAVRYLPEDDVADTAALSIASNDPLRPVVPVSWTGAGAPPSESYCCAELPPGEPLELDEPTCEGSGYVPPADPWDIALEWHWTGVSTATQFDSMMTMPAVGHMTDDDGDGSVGVGDVPDVAVVAFEWQSGYDALAYLVLIDGETGAEHWALPNFEGFGQPAIADIDGDGANEIVALTRALRVVAVDAAGNVEWTSSPSVTVTAYAPVLTVADLDGDGAPEVIADRFVLAGATGASLGTIPVSASIPYTLPAVADIDLDGEQEVILGDVVWSLSQGVEWSVPFYGDFGHWSAPVQADGDDQAEVLVLGSAPWSNPQGFLYDSDGTLLDSWTPAYGNASPPCVADFDGDGEVEFAVAGTGMFVVSKLDGSPVWSAAINDVSGLAGCSGYDVDSDGVYEIVYADESAMYVFDGATGDIRWTESGHASGTLWEYPVIADVDADGSAELLLMNDNTYLSGFGGLRVYGHADDGWLPSGPTWAVHDFATTNVEPDGHVPSDPPTPWIDPGVYRARPAADEPPGDLLVEIGDVCVIGCGDGGEASVGLAVLNAGLTTAPAGIPVAVYAGFDLLAVVELPWDVPSMTRSDAFEATFEALPLAPDELRAVVDDDGTGAGQFPECDEENNEATWAGTMCVE